MENKEVPIEYTSETKLQRNLTRQQKRKNAKNLLRILKARRLAIQKNNEMHRDNKPKE